MSRGREKLGRGGVRGSSGPRPGARAKEPSWRPDAVTPGQKFGTEERDNQSALGWQRVYLPKHFCPLVSLGKQCHVFILMRPGLCFLLAAYSAARFIYCTLDGRVIQKLLGPIHTHPRTAPASAFKDPHLLMDSQLPGPLCPSAGTRFFPITAVMEPHPVL